MASISVYDSTPYSLMLFLTNLDTDWANGTRTVNWYLGYAGGSVPTATDYYKCDTGNSLADGESFSDTVTFSGLSSNTRYYVLCEVYHGTTLLASLTGYATTDIATSNVWTVNSKDFGYITSKKTESLFAELYTTYRRAVKFSKSGTAKFYTTGDGIDTRGHLTSDTSFNDTAGWPNGTVLATHDDIGGGDWNFSISYEVKADTVYYIWFRMLGIEETGAITINIEPPGAEVTDRPANFAWTYPKVKGGEFNLTAAEWNALTTRISEFRSYKGLGRYAFTQAVSEGRFTAQMYNQARIAIQGISGFGGYIPTVSKGDTVTADMMNILVSELNVIP